MVFSRFLALRSVSFWAFALVVAGFPGWARACAQTPVQLVSAMAAKEVAARNEDNFYSYDADEVSDRTGGHRWTETVVETTDGPLHRLLAIDGRPLNLAEANAESERIKAIVRDPVEFRRLGTAHKGDEARSEQLLQLLPKAFLMTPAGEANGCTQFAFRANPAFQPSSYEEKVAVAMAGTVSFKEPQLRLCVLQASLIRPVEFGFGLLGKIEQGGRFRLQRDPVDAIHWKSDLISVHMQGRILLMKSLTREQEVRRTQIRLLPQRLSVAQAAQMIAP